MAEPFIWICLVAASTEGNTDPDPRIRAWTANSARAAQMVEQGLDMVPVFTSPPTRDDAFAAYRRTMLRIIDDLKSRLDKVKEETAAALAARPPAASVETVTDGSIQEGDVLSYTMTDGVGKITAHVRPVQSCSAGTGDATGWLIEKDDPPVYCVLSDDYDEHWTSDADKALRFARREDAQAYADHIGWTSPPVRIAEHLWPALEPMPRGGMKVDWWEQSVLYRRRLRALITLVEKEGYSVSSDGRNGMPMTLVRTGTEPQSSTTPADDLISQIEQRFPGWKSYRDLLDCIDCTLHQLRAEARS